MTQCAESQYKKQHRSDGAAGCGSDETTQIHRLNNPELDKVQAPPYHYLHTFLPQLPNYIQIMILAHLYIFM
jgi:hypothetical protein